jgi:hypothetical protein
VEQHAVLYGKNGEKLRAALRVPQQVNVACMNLLYELFVPLENSYTF